MQKREEPYPLPELVEGDAVQQAEETRPWTARLLTFRVLYFLLGFWCGVIAVLLILLTISTFYGWG